MDGLAVALAAALALALTVIVVLLVMMYSPAPMATVKDVSSAIPARRFIVTLDPTTERRLPVNGSEGRKEFPVGDLICPITLELPFDPVTAEDGRVYERSAIKNHIKTHVGELKSPMTNEKMGERLLPATQHKNLIEALVENGIIDGESVTKWNEKAKERREIVELLAKANNGCPSAMYTAAVKYYYGSMGFEEDVQMALYWSKKAHRAGNVKATAMAGEILIVHGASPCPESAMLGMVYLSTAAGQGSDFAAYTLGTAYADGLYGLAKDEHEAIFWLEKCLGDCLHRDLSDKCKQEAKRKIRELKDSSNTH